MLCKINYNDNEEEKIDETIDCQNVGENSKNYFFRDAFGEIIKEVPKKNVETILIG